MRCSSCPYYKWVRFYLPAPYGYSSDEDLPKKTDGFYLSREGLGKKCAACSRRAAKRDKHFDKDISSGKFRLQVSLDAGPLGLKDGGDVLPISPVYLDRLRPATSAGCTALPPDVEDVLRKAVAAVVQRVDYDDAAVLASVLRREPLAKIREDLKMERGEAVKAVRRVLDALEKARAVIRWSDCAVEGHDAAEELVERVVHRMTANDAPILLGLLRGDWQAEIARRSGLNSRQAAYGRMKLMLTRLPWVAKLREQTAEAAR